MHDGELPHVTWHAPGALASLPLHAAGKYSGDPTENAFETVISSYTPTLASLLPSNTKSSKSKATPSILVVALAQTPTGTTATEDAQKLFPPKSFNQLVDKKATPKAVLKAMGEHPWVHLACRASPAELAFLLHEGKLTLDELFKAKLSLGELAFLSGVGDRKGAHQVGPGLLAAGYCSVVVSNTPNASVAEVFYKTLLEEKKAGRGMRVAHALHQAVGQLRKEVGEENVAEWVQFAHYGV